MIQASCVRRAHVALCIAGEDVAQEGGSRAAISLVAQIAATPRWDGRSAQVEIVEFTDTFVAEHRVATLRYIVPSDDSFGSQWTLPEFDDAAWTQGISALGFEQDGDELTEVIV